jgi:hypothetical protein
MEKTLRQLGQGFEVAPLAPQAHADGPAALRCTRGPSGGGSADVNGAHAGAAHSDQASERSVRSSGASRPNARVWSGLAGALCARV